MWVWGLSAATVVLVVGGIVRAMVRRRFDPTDGLSVSEGWVVSQRGERDSHL
jgi:hypothetical protein